MSAFRIVAILASAGLLTSPACTGHGFFFQNFDIFRDGEVLTPSSLFYININGNGTFRSAGISLDPIYFPPVSRPNVLFADDGLLALDFYPGAPATRVSAFFTYVSALTLLGYDLDSKQEVVIHSLCISNLGGIGQCSPNEFISMPGTFQSILIFSDMPSTPFAMDNLTYFATPEPAGAQLVLVGSALLAGIGLRRRACTGSEASRCFPQRSPPSRQGRHCKMAAERSA